MLEISKRIVSTKVNNNAPVDFNELADMASMAKGSGHVRAGFKDGSFVVYGHNRGSVASIFHKSNPHKQEMGTLEVKKSLMEYVRDKSPQTQERALQLISRFVDPHKGGAVNLITNKDVLRIKEEVDKLEAASRPVANVVDVLRNGGNLLRSLAQNSGAIKSFAEAITDLNPPPEVRKHAPGVMIPEFRVAIALAVIDDLKTRREPSYQLLDALSALLPDGSDAKSRLREIVSQNTGPQSTNHFLGQLCDFVRKDLMLAQSYKGDNISNPNSKSEKMHIHRQARAGMQGFEEANTNDKIDRLNTIFNAHLNAPNYDIKREGQTIDPNANFDRTDNIPFRDRLTTRTPAEGLAQGLEIVLAKMLKV